MLFSKVFTGRLLFITVLSGSVGGLFEQHLMEVKPRLKENTKAKLVHMKVSMRVAKVVIEVGELSMETCDKLYKERIPEEWRSVERRQFESTYECIKISCTSRNGCGLK